jgi:hypothetical protein
VSIFECFCENNLYEHLSSYNPCYPFSESEPCLNVAACQSKCLVLDDVYCHSFCVVTTDASRYYVLGMNSIVTWSITAAGQVTLVYSTADRQTIVNLVCSDRIDQLVINNEYELRHYNMTLYSRCACWNGC